MSIIKKISQRCLQLKKTIQQKLNIKTLLQKMSLWGHNLKNRLQQIARNAFFSLIELFALLFFDTKDSFLLFLKHRNQAFSGVTYSYSQHKNTQKRVRFFTSSAFACIVLTTIITSSLIYYLMPLHSPIKAATFNFTQNSFLGGVDPTNFPKHPTGQTGWNRYFSKDDAVIAGEDLTINAQLANTTFSQNNAAEFAQGRFTSEKTYTLPDGKTFSQAHKITIHNQEDTNLTDYQVKFFLNTAQPIASGVMQSNCADVRVYTAGGFPVNYWLNAETCNTTQTEIWVKAPHLEKNSDTTLLLVYGNNALTTGSDSAKTFISYAAGNNIFNIGSRPRVVDFDWRMTTSPSASQTAGLGIGVSRVSGPNKIIPLFNYHFSASQNQTGVQVGSEASNFVPYSIEPGTWHRGSLVFDATTAVWKNNEQVVASMDSTHTDDLLTLSAGSGVTVKNLKVRKYTANEPTVTVSSNFFTYILEGDSLQVLTDNPMTSIFSQGDFGFAKKKIFKITNPTATAIANYPVKITLDSATLIASGQLRDDCADVYVTDEAGVQVAYYLDPHTCNTTQTELWVKLASLPASGEQTRYVYYGKSDASSQSNGAGIFAFYQGEASGTVNSSVSISTPLRVEYYVTQPSQPNASSTQGMKMELGGEGTAWVQSVGTCEGLYNRGCVNIVRLGTSVDGPMCRGNCPTVNTIFNTSDYLFNPATLQTEIKTGSGAVFPYVLGVGTARRQQVLVESGQFRWWDEETEILTESFASGNNLRGFKLSSGNESSFSEVRLRPYRSAETEPVVTEMESGSAMEMDDFGVYVSKVFAVEYDAVRWQRLEIQGSGGLEVQLRSANSVEGLQTAVWQGPTGVDSAYSVSGEISRAHWGHKFLQYKVKLTAAVLEGVGLTVVDYVPQSFISSPYYPGEGAILSALRWNGTFPVGSEVKLQMRTTTDNNGEPNSGAWTAFLGPDGSSDTFFTNKDGNEPLPAVFWDGVGDDWVQYKIYFTALNEPPVVSEVSVEYVVNASPVVSVISVVQNADGELEISFSASDSDEMDTHYLYFSAFAGIYLDENLTVADETAITVNKVEGLPSSGVILLDQELVAYSSIVGKELRGVTRNYRNTSRLAHSLGTEVYVLGRFEGGAWGQVLEVGTSAEIYDMTWRVAKDYPGVFVENLAKVQVSLNDGNGAFQMGSGTSLVLEVLDTKKPQVTSLVVDTMQSPAVVNVVLEEDGPDVQMKYASSPEELETTAWVGFANEWELNLDGHNVWYFHFKDWKGNVTEVVKSLPKKALNPLVQDVSNVVTGEWRLFFSFSPVTEVAGGFEGYYVYTADSAEGAWTMKKKIEAADYNYYMEPGLALEQPRCYKVRTKDLVGNFSEFSEVVCGAANGVADAGEGGGGAGDLTAPVISGVSVEDLTGTTAKIVWQTDENSDSLVEYGTESGVYNLSQGVPTFVGGGERHEVVLRGLEENVTYYFRVISADAVGNKGVLEDGGFSFITPTDLDAPVISGVEVEASGNSCVVTFATNEISRARVSYGLTTEYGLVMEGGGLNMNHHLKLTDLAPATTYNLKIRATDSSISGNYADSDNLTCTTFDSSDVTAPVISGVTVGGVTFNAATVNFSTSENAFSLVELGETELLGTIQGKTFDLTSSHSVNLLGLSPNTTYYFRIKAMDAAGNTGVSGTVYNFKTLEAPVEVPTVPVISYINIDNVTSSGAVVSWQTDIEADSVVGYSLDQSYTSEQGLSRLTRYHSVELKGLNAGTVYYVKIKSREAGGGLKEATTLDGNYLSFTTAEGANNVPPVITFDPSVDIVKITPTLAIINFSTDGKTNSLVDYSTQAGVFTSTQGKYKEENNIHSVTLFGLESNTTYYFQLRAEDKDGLAASLNNGGEGFSFKTLSGSDDSAPIISEVVVESVEALSAVVTWRTDEGSSSLVDFGKTRSYGATQGNIAELVTEHRVVLAGLSPNTVYKFRVKSIDEMGNSRVSDNQGVGFEFKTLESENSEDVTAPVITFNPEMDIRNVSPNRATIVWRTNELTDAVVVYGLGSLAQEQAVAELTMNHSVKLTGLSPNKTYQFYLKSQDTAGNVTIDNNGGNNYSFKTMIGEDTVATVISNVQVVSFTDSSATISWKTDKPASSLINFGVAAGDLKSIFGNYNEKVMTHTVTMAGLLPATKYYFSVQSIDENNNSTIDGGSEGVYSFTTTVKKDNCPTCSTSSSSSGKDDMAPVIAEVKVGDIKCNEVTVSWVTDEDGYSLVEYGTTEKLGSVFGSGIKFTNQHSVKVVGLKADTLYYFRVLSADRVGNLAQSPIGSFATLLASGDDNDKVESSTADNLTKEVELRIKELLASGLSDEEVRSIIAGSATSFRITSENPQVADVTNTSVRIHWKTDKKTNSVVRFRERGVDKDELIKEVGNFLELVLDHNVYLSGLAAGTVYEFQVQSTDVLGNTVKSKWSSLTTNTTPLIYDVVVSGINLNSAVVEWKTSTPSAVNLEYGPTLTYGEVAEGDGRKTVNHIVKLNNLKSGQVYHYRLKGVSAEGDVMLSDDYSFTTYTLPTINKYTVQEIGEREVVLEWEANVEVDATVRYTNKETQEVKIQGENMMLKARKFTLKGLEPGKNYSIQIQGRDTFGNQAVTSSFEVETLIDQTPPEFGRVSVETMAMSDKSGQVRAIISYTTSEPTVSQVLYGQGDDYDQSVEIDPNYTTNHITVITNFRPASVYKFRIIAEDRAGNKQTSKDFTVLVPAEKRSVIQMITDNFESTFSWVKNVGK